MDQKNYVTTTIIGLALYLISTGLSYAAFSYAPVPSMTSTDAPIVSGTPMVKNPDQHFVVDPQTPKTEVCPINGMMYTKQEKDAWSKVRPIAAMIENHEDARPQSGLSSADIVYEAVAEGGITRFMGVFYCASGATNIKMAPVRSARTYWLPWVLEYDALYVHVGGAGNCNDPTVDTRAKALCQIEQYGIKDLSQFGLPVKIADASGNKIFVCHRVDNRVGREVATEHTMVCETDGLHRFAEAEKNWTNVDAKGVSWDKTFVPYKYKDDAKEAERGTVVSIAYSAWKGYEAGYGEQLAYDKAANVYKRSIGGVAHTDWENKQQLASKVVIIIFAKETRGVDEHGHLLYNNIGSGDGLVFQDGQVIKIAWRKENKNARMKFYDTTTNKEMVFNRGQMWINMLPTGTTVTY